MARKILVFVVAFIAALHYTCATITVTSDFGNYAQIVNKLPNMNDRLTVFRAVWGEIRADGIENVDRLKKFYDDLQQYTKGAVNSEAEEAAELIEEVREVLIIENGLLIAQTLQNNGSEAIPAVAQFRNRLLNNYPLDLLNAIYVYAIDKIYVFKSTNLLHAELESINGRTENAHIFQWRVHWNLYLYFKFLQRGDVNDEYLYAVARTFHNIKRSIYLNSVSTDTVRRINTAYDMLPSSLNNLFGSQSICLSNTNFANYYLYFKDPVSSSNAVQAVVSNANLQRTIWNNGYASVTLEKDTPLVLRTANRSWFLYRRTTDNKAVIQSTDSQTIYRNWMPTLRNEKIYLANAGYYMCSSEIYDNALGGFIVDTKLTISFDDPKCQWTITDCSEFN